jgi:sterol 14-demethylase
LYRYSPVTTLVHDLDKGMVPLSVFFPYAPIEVGRCTLNQVDQ